MLNSPPNILQSWLCSKDHKMPEYNEFVALSVDECLRFVKVNELCFNCLLYSRMINSCKS